VDLRLEQSGISCCFVLDRHSEYLRPYYAKMKKQVIKYSMIMKGGPRVLESPGRRLYQADIRGYAAMKKRMAEHGLKIKGGHSQRENGLVEKLPVQSVGYNGRKPRQKWVSRGTSSN